MGASCEGELDRAGSFLMVRKNPEIIVCEVER
jgi:hypothetical protein